MCALGLGVLTLQPVYYRRFGSAVFPVFCDFILSTKWALLPRYRRRCRSVVPAAASAAAAAALLPLPPPRCRQAAAATAVAFIFIVALCWRTYKKHKRKEGAKQECLEGR